MENSNHFNVIVIGAGISGIGAGYYLKKNCPNKSFCIIEGRENIGGTWDLFKYPGIRSDSDMFTLGYAFKPWKEQKTIANGPSILSYLEENTVIGNAARGDIVDDDAMIEALKSGKVFAYGLDVYNGEPKIHPEYLKLKNIFLLPHLGSATKRTRWDMAFRATKNLEDFFSGKKPQDQVN